MSNNPPSAAAGAKRKLEKGSREDESPRSVGKVSTTTTTTTTTTTKGKEKAVKRHSTKVGQACIYCRRSHMTCDSGRPCQRCVKRDIGHLCRDETAARSSTGGNPKQAGAVVRRSSSHSTVSAPSPLKNESTPQQHHPPPTASVPPTSTPLPPSAIFNVLAGGHLGGAGGAGSPMMGMMPPTQTPYPQQRFAFAAPDIMQANAILSAQQSNNNMNNSWIASMLGGASFLGLGGGDPIGAGSGLAASGDAAGGNEYNILSEFLESLDGTSALPTPAAPTNMDATATTSTGTSTIGAPAEMTNGNGENSVGSQATHSLARNRRMSLADTATSLSANNKTETFFLTAADQKDGSRDERLGRVIQAKLDAGLLRPYNHVKGYARLNQWMEHNCNQTSRRRILKPLSIFRPAFRAVAQRLTNVDLIFIEEAFERLLLDYDRVFSTQGIPACLWRRTGEIYKGNKEFADLVGVEFEALRDGQCTIYELMQEESAVNYWEKYGAVCFDPGQKAVLTSCVLKTNNHKRAHRGTMSAPLSGFATPLPPPQQPTAAKEATSKASSPGPTIVTPEKGNAKKSTAFKASSTTDAAPKTPKGSVKTDAPLDDGQSQRETDENHMTCCFSFTIRRDSWGIPYAIVGNFLPLTR